MAEQYEEETNLIVDSHGSLPVQRVRSGHRQGLKVSSASHTNDIIMIDHDHHSKFLHGHLGKNPLSRHFFLQVTLLLLSNTITKGKQELKKLEVGAAAAAEK